MDPSARLVNLVTAWTRHMAADLDERIAAATGLRPQGAAAVVLLANHPGENIQYLRARLLMSHPGCVRLVARLEAKGLVRRGAADDARAVALRLTAAGTRAADTIHRLRRELIAAELGALDDQQAGELTALLETLLCRNAPADEPVNDSWCVLCAHGDCLGDGSECPVDAGLAQAGA